MRRRRIALGILFAASLAGCTTEQGTEKPCGSAVPAGRIQGTVVTGGLPVAAKVTAASVPAAGQFEQDYTVLADTTGRYQLDVPAGSYFLSAEIGDRAAVYYYARIGPQMAFDQRDVVVVSDVSPPVWIDFPLSGLDVHLSSVAVPDGREVDLVLVLSGYAEGDPHDTSIRLAAAHAASGAVDFRCAGLFPGVYRLKVRVPVGNPSGTNGEEFWLPPTRDPARADSIRADAGSAVRYDAALAGASAHIEGEVVGSWQELRVSGAVVSLVSADSAVVAHEPASGTGTFSFDLILPVPVKIQVDIGGSVAWVGGRTFRDATLFDLPPGGSVTGIRVVESGLKVSVADPTDPDAWDARVLMYDAADRSLVSSLDLTPPGEFSDHSGISNLEPGSYLVRIQPQRFGEDWLPQWYDRASSADAATAITVPGDGAVVPITLTLQKGARITGTIDMQRAATPDNYVLFVTRADSSGLLGSIDVSARGQPRPVPFTVPGLADGDYKLGGWPRWYLERPDLPPPDTRWYPGTAAWDSAAAISIRNQADATGIDIRIP